MSTTKTLTKMTLAQAFEIYRARPRWGASRSPMTIDVTEYVLTKYANVFWDRPIASITKRDCADLFAQLTEVGPSVANKTMCSMRAVINVARDVVYTSDDGENCIFEFSNPVTLMLKTTPLNPERCSSGRIPRTYIRAVWRALKQRGERAPKRATRTAADWLRFRMMTGMRAAESRALRYSHIDWEHNLIALPGTMTMNCRPLILPMTPQMRELIEHRRALQLARHPDEEVVPDAYIFDSDASPSGHIMSARAILKAEAGQEITEFDIRRTFADVATACDVVLEVKRRLLNLVEHDDIATSFPNSTDDLLDALTRIAEWLDLPEVVEAEAPSAASASVDWQPSDGRHLIH